MMVLKWFHPFIHSAHLSEHPLCYHAVLMNKTDDDPCASRVRTLSEKDSRVQETLERNTLFLDATE